LQEFIKNGAKFHLTSKSFCRKFDARSLSEISDRDEVVAEVKSEKVEVKREEY